MGPFALLDLVGLDTSLAILDALYAEFRDPNYAAVPLLRRMVAAEPARPEVRPGLLRLRPLTAPPRHGPGARPGRMVAATAGRWTMADDAAPQPPAAPRLG